jgi:hypothetical protein
MKKASLLLFLLFCDYFFSQNPGFNWAKSVGSGANDIGRAVCTDQQGNVYVTGTFSGTVDFDPGPGIFNLNAGGLTNAFLLKLNAQGNFVWAGSIQSVGSTVTSAWDIKTDLSGNVYLVGIFGGTVDFDFGPGTFYLSSLTSNDNFVCKYTSNGTLIWTKQTGGGSNTATLDLNNNGNIYICSNFIGTKDFDPGPATYTLSSFGSNDAFVSALDNSGNFLWAKQFGGPNTDAGTIISCSKLSGDIFISGQFTSIADFDPGLGTYSLSSFGNTDIFVCRLSAAGNFIWAGQLGGPSNDNVLAIALDSLDNLWITGAFIGTADFDPGAGQYTLNAVGTAGEAFIVKLGATGNFIFAKQFITGNPTSTSFGRDIVVGTNGEIYVVGGFNVLTDFDPGPATYTLLPMGTSSAYFINLDNLGNFVSVKQFGGSGITSVIALLLDNSNNFYGAGAYTGSSDFDPDAGTYSLSSNGSYDVFIVKLSDCIDAPLSTSGFYYCAGSTVTLSATSNGNLSWYTSLTATSAIANGSVMVTPTLSAATYTYYVESSTCTTSVIRTPVIFSVAPLPQLQLSSNPLILCMGNIATLSVSGANTYTWQNGSQSSSISVSPTLSTQYSVAASNTINGCKNTNSLLLNVAPLPLIQVSAPQGSVCAGSAIKLQASGASSYTWNTGVISSSIMVTPLLSTNYTVIGTSSLGCISSQSVSIKINACLGLSEQQFVNESFIYPNPTKDKLTIQTNGDVDFVLINNLGEIVLETKILAGENSIDLSILETGVYFITLSCEIFYKRFKVIKMQ